MSCCLSHKQKQNICSLSSCLTPSAFHSWSYLSLCKLLVSRTTVGYAHFIVEEVVPREVEWLSHSHTAGKWQRWIWTRDSLTFGAWAFALDSASKDIMLGRGLGDDVPSPEGMREARPACLLSRLCLPLGPRLTHTAARDQSPLWDVFAASSKQTGVSMELRETLGGRGIWKPTGLSSPGDWSASSLVPCSRGGGQDGGVGRLQPRSIKAEQWATKLVPRHRPIHFSSILEKTPFSVNEPRKPKHKIIMRNYQLLMDYANHAKHVTCIAPFKPNHKACVFIDPFHRLG